MEEKAWVKEIINKDKVYSIITFRDINRRKRIKIKISKMHY